MFDLKLRDCKIDKNRVEQFARQKNFAHDFFCYSRDARPNWRSKHAAQDNVRYTPHCARAFILWIDIFAVSVESTRPSRPVHCILAGVRVAYADGAFTVGFRFANAENRGAESAKNLARKAFPN